MMGAVSALFGVVLFFGVFIGVLRLTGRNGVNATKVMSQNPDWDGPYQETTLREYLKGAISLIVAALIALAAFACYSIIINK